MKLIIVNFQDKKYKNMSTLSQIISSTIISLILKIIVSNPDEFTLSVFFAFLVFFSSYGLSKFIDFLIMRTKPDTMDSED